MNNGKTTGDSSDQIRYAFWTQLLALAAEKTTLHEGCSPSVGQNVKVSAGLSGLKYTYAVRKHDAFVELSFEKPNAGQYNAELFHQLERHKNEIEARFGESLDWEEMKGHDACRIKRHVTLGGWRDEPVWPQVHDELIDCMIRLERAFRDHISRLSQAAPDVPDASAVDDELKYRWSIWKQIQQRPQESTRLDRSELGSLGLGDGTRPYWVDEKRRAGLSADSYGVTIAVHIPTDFPLEHLQEDFFCYSYAPEGFPADTNQQTVEATKNAAKLSLPVFVVIASNSIPGYDVRLGWVEDWDDNMKQFLISLGENKPHRLSETEDRPFSLKVPSDDRSVISRARRGQQQFQFNVLKRYESACAFCGVDIPAVLDAAHLCEVKHQGSDDCRNGLVLCALHHRAFDAQLIGIHRNTSGNPRNCCRRTWPGIE